MSAALSPEVWQMFSMVKNFQEPTQPCISIDFDDSGEYAVVVSQDESFHIYNCKSGTLKKTLYSKKYGIHLARFAHTPSTLIHTATKNDSILLSSKFDQLPYHLLDHIRYMSVHDNKYLRYFVGHDARVVSMDMCPVNDTFISGAMDDTVRLWDLRAEKAQGLTNVTGTPHVAFDPEGLVFAIGLGHSIRFYDVRNFDKGPFDMAPIPGIQSPFDPALQWTGIKFSNSNNDILVSTRSNKIYVLDGHEFKFKYALTDFENSTGLDLEASFTPDARYIVSGSSDGKVHAWEVQSGKKVAQLDGHKSPVTTVKFNPRYMMMVSGADNVGMWLPVMD